MSTKDKVLHDLLRSGGKPVSGQQMADRLGVSRTAIWKCIKELESEGYTIESVRKKGYVLHQRSDEITAVRLAPYLETKRYGRVVHTYDSCETTQMIAHDKAQLGADEGTLIVSDEQTAGRGRLMRPWSSPSGHGIWMSLIIRPNLSMKEAPQVTLVTAVAIVRALEKVAAIDPVIKWPNDLLVGGKKIAGILTEMQADPDQVQALIIGIGLNVHQRPSDFPDELREQATSVAMETGEAIERAKLVAAIMNEMERFIDMYERNGFEPIKLLWESYAVTTGQLIRATLVDEVIEGVARGISDDGLLQIEEEDGTIRSLYSADVTLQ